jgi:hypothetical protein
MAKSLKKQIETVLRSTELDVYRGLDRALPVWFVEAPQTGEDAVLKLDEETLFIYSGSDDLAARLASEILIPGLLTIVD